MSTYAEKKEENQNAASNHLNTPSEAEASMVSTDHRSEAVSQMKLQEMDPIEHDQHIAYVSHISHISSFMLGKTVMEKEKDEKAIFDMAGSGFASTVRLAKSSPSMWAPIFVQNKKNILDVLTEYISNLEEFKKLIQANDYKSIYQKIERTNAIKEILEGIK